MRSCFLTEEGRKEAKEVADRLICAFSWEDTPQGHSYWKTVYDALMELSECEKSA